MKNSISFLFIVALLTIQFSSCKKIVYPSLSDVVLDVNFDAEAGKKESDLQSGKKTIDLTKQTPLSYEIAIKSAKLIGENNTSDFTLFNEANLDDALIFDFEDNTTAKSLLQSANIPDGEYSSISLDIYFLQMKLNISTTDYGIEQKNIRIYMSDDAEYENGLHQPGDMTQINAAGIEEGWLLGEGVSPNMIPVNNRLDAYTEASDGITWYQFADKSAENYGPFGDMDFWSSVSQPIFTQSIILEFTQNEVNEGDVLKIDFNIKDCWQFEDKNGDFNFGPQDLDPIDPTAWEMILPSIEVSLN